jgi:hypothetical protein
MLYSEGDWVPAGALLVGDEVLKADGRFGTVQADTLAHPSTMGRKLPSKHMIGPSMWRGSQGEAMVISDRQG